MNRLMVLIILSLLSACSTVSEFIPSLEYCDEVSYQRIKTDIDVKLKCEYKK